MSAYENNTYRNVFKELGYSENEIKESKLCPIALVWFDVAKKKTVENNLNFPYKYHTQWQRYFK